MDEEAPAHRSDAAWKANCDEVARRNQDAHKRAQKARDQRGIAVAAAARADAEREADQLRTLNERLAKQRARVASVDRV